ALLSDLMLCNIRNACRYYLLALYCIYVLSVICEPKRQAAAASFPEDRPRYGQEMDARGSGQGRSERCLWRTELRDSPRTEVPPSSMGEGVAGFRAESEKAV